MSQTVNRLPTMQETQVQSLVGKISWRRKWQSTPVFLPGKSHGWRRLVGYSPWGCKELDTTERLHFLSNELEPQVAQVAHLFRCLLGFLLFSPVISCSWILILPLGFLKIGLLEFFMCYEDWSSVDYIQCMYLLKIVFSHLCFWCIV